MLKQIPKSNISNRNFQVYKSWQFSNTDYPITNASDEAGLFDTDTSNQENGFYTDPLYNSIKTKYYSADGNVFSQYGVMKNPADYELERAISTEIQVISIPQKYYGEQIKKGSVELYDLDHDVLYIDNAFGTLINDDSEYYFVSYDAETEIMVITVNGVPTNTVVSSFDVNTGIAVFTIDQITDHYYVAYIDFQTNIISLSEPLIFQDTDITEIVKGNVFYDDGLIVLTNALQFINYTLKYKSVQTIHETEVLVSVTAGEFNYSQNPTAVEVVLENEYDFVTTPISSTSTEKTIHIKEIQDIFRTEYFHGTYQGQSNTDPLGTGSWDDYFLNQTSDPTGSYLTPYITTIGLYDDSRTLVAVAKLPKPIKNLPDYNTNFLIRFDT